MTLRVVCIRSLEEAQALGSQWDDLVDETGADIYFQRAWITVWWRHFGRGRQLACMLVYQADKLVALLPFFVESIRLGSASIKIGRLAGLMHYFAVLKLPVAAGFGPEICEALQGSFHSLLGCHALIMASISARCPDLADLRLGLASTAQPGFFLEKTTAEHAIIHLTDTFPGYLELLSSKRRRKQERTKGILERIHGASSIALTGEQGAGFFDEFVQRHNDQWLANGRLGHFGDWRRNAAFFRDALQTLQGGSVARFYVQRDGSGAFIGAQFCFVHGDTCVAVLAARKIHPDLDPLGVGTYGQFERIESLIAEKVKMIDSGQGDYDHKRSLGGVMTPLHRLILCKPGWSIRLRLQVLLVWSDLVDLAYYRFWFVKVAPSVRRLTGRAKRPLWDGWIRTRL